MRPKQELFKLIKFGIGFIVFCFLVLWFIEKSLSILVAHSNDSQTGKINLFMAHKIDPEILFLGSSVAEVGFNANLISETCNKKVYNGAIDGTTVIQSQFIIEEFLSYSKNCKQIVIGLAFFSFAPKNSMTEPSRFLAHFNNPNVKNNIKHLSPDLYSKLQYVPFYAFTQYKQTYYKNAAFGLKNLIYHKPLNSDSLNGYVPHDTPWNGEQIMQNQFATDSIGVYPETIENYIQIIENIKQKGIEPILLITPMYIDGQKLFKNYNAFIEAAHNIAKKTQIRILDFSCSDIIYNNNYFYNNGHLNSTGANIFSKQVADSLLVTY